MRLESVERLHTPAGERCRVRISGGETLRMTPALLAELGLYAGQELSQAELAEIRQRCGAASAKERAVRIVSASQVSARELEHRLVQKGEREEDAAEAVRWMQELALLDDRQTAAQIVRAGASRGYGAARVRQMLYEKRVPRELWDEALAQLPAPDDALDAFLQSRFRGKTPDRAACKRAADALLRRGHRWSDIRRALERYAPEEEFLED